MISHIQEYKNKIMSVGDVLTYEFSKIDGFYMELKKIANYDDAIESLYEYKKTEMQELDSLLGHLINIQKTLAALKEFCNDEVNNFATAYGIKFDDAKSVLNVIAVLSINKLELGEIEIEALSFNEKLRSTLHQLSAIMQNILSVNGISRKFKLQEMFPDKKVLKRDEMLMIIEASQMDCKRLERTWLELISLNSENDNATMGKINSSQFASYLSLQNEKLSNYYFFGKHKVIFLIVDGLEEFDFISNFDKITEIMDVIINNAAEELCDKEISEIENGNDISHKQINISITKSTETDSFTIRIKDNGRGISDTRIIFEPYYTTKKEKGGSGIGLAAAIKLVNSLLGSVIVNTSINKGSTFYITFPLNSNNIQAEV